MEVLHPPVVHFVIALTVTGILFEISRLVFKKEIFNSGSLLNLMLAVVFAWIAFFAGHLDEEKFEKFIEHSRAYTTLEYHETLGLVVAILITALGFLKLIEYFKGSRLLRSLLIILCLVTFILVLLQGNLGGKLVYEYGTGVKPVMEGLK
ncbi:MAG: hypothetical protein DSY32_00835 [Aquifex sp.]|nr:MAG: hypothetical protein DSY32_00835 [Aquifex sp.]